MKGKLIAFLTLALAVPLSAHASDNSIRGGQEVPSDRVMLAQRAEPLLAMRPSPDPFLSLPPERAARLHALQDEMKRQYGQLEERLVKLRASLDEVYGSYRLDERRRRSLQAAIGETQDQLLELHYSFQLKLRGILTEAEFETLQRRIRDARERKLATQKEEEEKKLRELQRESDPDGKKRGDQ